MRILVAGGGGFIGHALIKRLKAEGHWVRAVDWKYPEFEHQAADHFICRDLRHPDVALQACQRIDQVYQLAADMGGIGKITKDHAEIARNNIRINTNLLEAARICDVGRYLFTSSACAYPTHLQEVPDSAPLKESDAWPARPEEGYGLEKLFTEKLCQYYRQDFRLDTRVVRFFNVYGPYGTWTGGREKAPAAICRKVAMAPDGGTIEVWGDGQQTRSFLYIDDCLEGLLRLMASDHVDPLNLGSDELVTINQLVDLTAAISGKVIRKQHRLDAPQGVRGRQIDNTQLKAVLGWHPTTTLRDGLAITYPWIVSQVLESCRQAA